MDLAVLLEQVDLLALVVQMELMDRKEVLE
jgi:hypothetical protein